MSNSSESLNNYQTLLFDFSPPFTKSKSEAFRRKAISLERSFSNLDDIIVVGIAGGTGVGKSTLINALAGDYITEANIRRPTSNHVVVYQHKDLSFATRLPAEDLELEERHHSSEDLGCVIILDLPDCDSMNLRHKRIMEQVLPHTDLLLLVTDINKYGDRSFYELCAACGHALQNKIIVFNKTDLIKINYGDKSSQVLSEILSDFTEKFKKFLGNKPPRIFPISAYNAFNAKNSGNKANLSFLALENALIKLKDKKLRERIKHHNLEAAFNNFNKDLLKELEQSNYQDKTASFEKILNSTENNLIKYTNPLIEANFKADSFREFKRYLVGRVVKSWSFPARIVAKFSRLTFTGPIPESALLTQDFNAFNKKLWREIQHLKNTFETDWKAKVPATLEKPDFCWDLREKIENLVGSARRKHFFWIVAIGILCILFFAARPALVDLLNNMNGTKNFSELFKDFLILSAKGILEYLEPFLLLSWVIALLAAYIIAIVMSLLRIENRSEHKLIKLSKDLSLEMKATIQKHLSPFYSINKKIREKADAFKALIR